MLADDFIAIAKDLAARSGNDSPGQSGLRRAVSTAYYALFHCLANCCADTLVGGPGSGRSEPAWHQAYRALQHGTTRSRCNNLGMIQRFPVEIQDFARQFVRMQRKREDADYDPSLTLVRADVIVAIERTEQCIAQFDAAPDRDRRAFAVYVLLNLRNN